MTSASSNSNPSIPLDQFRVLIICRGPIAMEAMEIANALGMPKPHIAVSKREVFESLEARAPWSEHTHLYEKLFIVDEYKEEDEFIEYALDEGLHGIYVGYGYNAENNRFVAKCEKAGIIPIAPPSSVMEFSGSKFEAKRHVGEKLGIRVLPGSDKAAALAAGGKASDQELIDTVTEEAAKIFEQAPGQIVRLKAVKSGGGKGQRLISQASQVMGAVKEIWAEIGARGLDGDKGTLVEANLAHPRHWEIQVISDGETTVHFGGRECSIQNAGSQKFIEVSLHPGQYDRYIDSLDPKKDATLIALLGEEQDRIRDTCNHAVEIIQSLGYKGAATVEFLVAEDGGAEILGRPHFMEINSRIQVEHRVSEAISKIKGKRPRLVGEQYRIACGEKLGYTQADIEFEGYAFEARINASNSNFLIGASGSEIEIYEIPETSDDFYYDDGGTQDLFVQGKRRRWAVPNFDSNFGLAVFIGATQQESFERARDMLKRFRVEGNDQLKTTRSFHLAVLSLLLDSPPYGKIRTDFSEIYLAFGSKIFRSLAQILPPKATPGDPFNRLLVHGLKELQAEPGLAIALAYYDEGLMNKSVGATGLASGRASNLLRELAELTQIELHPEEEKSVFELTGEIPEVVEQILTAVRESEIMDFRRQADSLEFDIPDSVRQSRARRLLIDELRDATIENVIPRNLSAREVDDMKEIMQALEGKIGEHVANSDLAETVRGHFARTTEPLNNHATLSPVEFRVFYDALRDLKWTLRKGDLPIDSENALISEINRATRVARGPNVVAHLAGTIYLRPSPDTPLYVEVGDEVVADETVVALLENMKMFNEIRAHMSGKVKEILVENERPVLPGQVILVIE